MTSLFLCLMCSRVVDLLFKFGSRIYIERKRKIEKN